MKYVVAVTVSLLLGVIVGMMSQRPELRRAEETIATLEDRECSPRRTVGRGLAAAVQGQPQRMVQPDEEEFEEEPEDQAEPEDGVVIELGGGPDEEAGRPDDDAEDVREELDLMATAQDLRRAQARAALLEQTDLDDDELQNFDDAVGAMNEDLVELAGGFVDQLEDQQDISRKDMMVFAADMLDVMIVAEESFEDTFDGQDLDAIDEEAIDPFSYIAPELIDILGELDL